jgi:hypothetical protein
VTTSAGKGEDKKRKARMIGRGFSVLPSTEEEIVIAPAKSGSDILSRLEPKQKENTRQNSGMTKQLANLLSLHQTEKIDKTERSDQYLKHLSNKSLAQHSLPLQNASISDLGDDVRPRIGLQKTGSVNLLQQMQRDASQEVKERKGTHKNTASFLHKFQADDANQAQY